MPVIPRDGHNQAVTMSFRIAAVMEAATFAVH